MWLFVYRYHGENITSKRQDFKIVNGYSFKYALVNFYNTFAHTIDNVLFSKMIEHLDDEDAIEIFNNIINSYRIESVYSGLKEEYSTVLGGL